jgi:hypothetical protein
MNPPASTIAALCELGFTLREAEFLYLAAIHSGFFLQRQFDQFVGERTSGAFVLKAQRKGIKAETCRRGAKLYHIQSCHIYAAAGVPESRNRQPHSHRTIATRLLALDFVLAHLDKHFLHTEQQKAEYLITTCNLGPRVLPTTVFRSSKNQTTTYRSFPDNFPMFLTNGTPPTPPLVTFTFVDNRTASITSFKTHLERYLKLFAALRQFNFIFISNSSLKFDSAQYYFYLRLWPVLLLPGLPSGLKDHEHLLRFFVLRNQWDDPQQRGNMPKEQVLLLSHYLSTYNEPYDALYENWHAQQTPAHASSSEVPPTPPNSPTFSTHLLKSKLSMFGDYA